MKTILGEESMKTIGAESSTPVAAGEADDCEWVDDAVLNLSAAFSLCDGHNYAQVEFEHKTRSFRLDCQPLPAVLDGGTAASPSSAEKAVQLPNSNLRCSPIVEDHSLETLGTEVQLQSITIY